MNSVAENTKAIMNEKGLKHKSVAEKAGYSVQQFSNMLNGRKNILDIDVWRIACALGVLPKELFGIKTSENEKGG